MTLSIDFNLPFAEAIAAIVAKGVVLPDEFYHGIPAKVMKDAFTVSLLEGIGPIADIKAKLLQHLEQGGTLATFQKWAAGQDWTLTKAHLETVYRNAIQSAYNAGHWVHFEASKGTHPYLRYSAVNDSRTRPSHRKLHGVIRPVDDPFWDGHSPPLGHRCRCTLMALTQKQADELGGVTHDVPADANADGPGWGRKPEHRGEVLKQMVERRLAEAGGKMAQAVREIGDNAKMKTPSTEDIVKYAEKARTDDGKTKHLILSPVINTKRIATATGIDLTDYRMILDAAKVKHIIDRHGNPEKEAKQGQRAVTMFDFALIPLIVDQCDSVDLSPTPSNGALSAIRFTKTIGTETYVFVAEVRPGKKHLAPATLYVKV